MANTRELIVVGLAVVCALILMSLPPSYKIYIAERCQVGLLVSGQALFSQVSRYAHNEEKSRFLLTQNAALALGNMQMQEAAWENVRLRKALSFRPIDESTRVISAEVIGRDPDHIYDTIVINAGREHGVDKDMPVVTPEGLVGHIAQVGASDSVVQLLMRTRVSALIQATRAQGIVAWIDGQFRLQFVEASNLVQEGDLVVSSGLGGRYPKGIPIGTVVEVSQEKRAPVFLRVVLKSLVDFAVLEEVFVLGKDPRPG